MEIRKVAYSYKVSASSILNQPDFVHGGDMGKRSVLLVDDDARYRRVMTTFLAEMKEVDEVLTAADGQAAIDMIATQDYAPELVLLDLFMPVMSGLEALPVLRKQLPEQTGIIVLSANESQAYEDATLSAGADAFVNKIDTAVTLPKVMRDVSAVRKKQ